MKTRSLLCFAAAALVVSAVWAGGLDKYRDWPNTPQGYFMTAAERAEWKSTVKTDAEAEEFVKKFLARRDAGFAADVASRAAMADKHLTMGGRAGSLTTRGKMIILLGPPTSFAVADHVIKGHISGTPDMYANVGGTRGGSTVGPGVGDMAQAAASRGMSENLLKDYTFVYTADKLPVKQAKELTVVIEVKPSDGTDRILDRKKAAELDELFEAVATQRIAAKP